MRLLAVPRALGPQLAHQFDEPHHLGRHGRGEHRQPQRGEVVGVDHARSIEVGPRDLAHGLVGQPEPLQHDGRRRRVVLERELDLGQHLGRVALRHQQWARLAGGVDREALAVDDAHRHRDRVDPEPGPREVEERQAGHDLDLDPPVRPQQLDGALGDQR